MQVTLIWLLCGFLCQCQFDEDTIGDIFILTHMGHDLRQSTPEQAIIVKLAALVMWACPGQETQYNTIHCFLSTLPSLWASMDWQGSNHTLLHQIYNRLEYRSYLV